MAEQQEEAYRVQQPLNHIAFIMDGNGRWAKKRFLPRSLGHKAGVRNVKRIVDLCFKKYDIRYCSLFVFSTENWNRSDKEISYLFNLMGVFFRDNIKQFIQDGTKVVVSGDLEDERIPTETIDYINEAVHKTRNCENYVFNVLFNYGGRREIATAAKKIAIDAVNKKIKPEDINEKMFGQYLYQPDMPDIDLLVRTSGEERVSNCLLYEIAYAEMVFPKTYWPDFSEADLVDCLKEYDSRSRRFGGT